MENIRKFLSTLIAENKLRNNEFIEKKNSLPKYQQKKQIFDLMRKVVFSGLQEQNNDEILVHVIFFGAIQLVIPMIQLFQSTNKFYNICSKKILKMDPLMHELNQAFNLVSQANNQSIKNGESILKRLQTNPTYPLLLIEFMKQSSSQQSKLRSSIELRIWCEKFERLDEYEQQYYKDVLENVKSNIVLAYLGYEGKIQKTLLPGIVSLTAVEFPDRWEVLIDGLLKYCREDQSSTLKVLTLFQEITHKYTYLTRSDPLYKQIIIVCNQLHDFLLNLTQNLAGNIVNMQHIPDNIVILETLMKLFYNLNYQDLHPKYEDNLNRWMGILKDVMNLPNTKFFKCKGAALESILLYASKYKEDVENQIKGFSQDIWEMCANASPDPEYDDIVFSALKYFRSLIVWPDMKSFFYSKIQNLMTNLILPNLVITKDTMDLFNEETQSFIANYFRNGEIQTRRAAALELLKAICRGFDNFEAFIQSQVTGYSRENSSLENESLLLNLVIESASKSFRDIDGTTQLYLNQEIVQYCYQNIVKNTLNEIYTFCSENQNQPIEMKFNVMHLVITLRYVYYFRIYLPAEDLVLILKLCSVIKTQNSPLKSILFLVINAFITVKHGDFIMFRNIVPYFNEKTLQPVTVEVLRTIYEYDKDQPTLNQLYTKTLYNITKHLGQASPKYYQYFSYIIDSMLKKTVTFDFSSISGLFEALGNLAYWMSVSKSDRLNEFETKIYQYFQASISRDSDTVNFCLQILAILAQFTPNEPGKYQNVYKSILQTSNWKEENLSIMSSYVQYLGSFIKLKPQVLLDDKAAFHNILRVLVGLDRYDLFFRLLHCILKVTDIDGFYDSGFLAICLNSYAEITQKSPFAIKTVLSFIFTITWNYKTEKVIQYMNNIFANFYENCLLNNQSMIQTIQARRQKKLMYGSICNALVTGCFSNPDNEALLLNLLIDNSTGRFRLQKLSDAIKEIEVQEKKESTFKKLEIFKEIDGPIEDVSIDQEVTLVQAYQMCLQRNPGLSSKIHEKNVERIKRLYDKHSRS